jgi:uncharacterized protein with von Willebrand factor type A (vWA) domain
MRDFLKEAQSVFGSPRPLRDLLSEDRDALVATLVKFLGNPDIYKRKYAAFCLGQIGESSVLDDLQSAYDRESVRGAKEAMGAALVALERVPPEASMEERATAVENVYEKRPWDAKAETGEQTPSATAAKGASRAGCLTIVLCSLFAATVVVVLGALR